MGLTGGKVNSIRKDNTLQKTEWNPSQMDELSQLSPGSDQLIHKPTDTSN